jgi:ParB family transcriptional regulator, chromosome partitioning protein
MRHDFHYVEELTRSGHSVGRTIPINKIEPNPEQPRVEIGDLTELTNSVKQKGVLEPLLVKPNRDKGTWMIIAGERRWRAANLAGLSEVPCIELDIDEQSIAEIALIENMQRKDLTVWEEADGLAFLSERFGYTHDEIARKISKSRTTVTEAISVAGLPDHIRKRCREANINAKSTLLEIARQFDEKTMHEFLDNIERKNLSREQIRQTARPAKEKADAAAELSKSSAKNKNSFQFVSKENGFTLEIKFDKADAFETKDVLRALKEAFDKTKNKK